MRSHSDPLIRHGIGRSSEEDDDGSFLESEEDIMLPVSGAEHEGEDNNQKDDFKMCKGIFFTNNITLCFLSLRANPLKSSRIFIFMLNRQDYYRKITLPAV